MQRLQLCTNAEGRFRELLERVFRELSFLGEIKDSTLVLASSSRVFGGIILPPAVYVLSLRRCPGNQGCQSQPSMAQQLPIYLPPLSGRWFDSAGLKNSFKP